VKTGVGTPPLPHPGVEEVVRPGETQASAVAVSTLTQTARSVVERAFRPLWVRGEVRDFTAHRNGHWYFSLRDDKAQLRCVVWASDQGAIPAPPDNGMQVVAFGQVSVYAARGDVQLVVSGLEAEGDGLYRKAIERTLRALQADGLLAPERKRPLPPRPRRIAVITSASGAAIHDIAAVVRRRAPAVEVILVPARVQGEGAADELCAALALVARWGQADLVIIGRGGGASEDLRAFNDERVARAVAACRWPTISAVGHEIDLTICDMVADLRAPTPSVAGERAVPAYADDLRRLHALTDLVQGTVTRWVRSSHDRLERAAHDVSGGAAEVRDRRVAQLRAVAGRLEALSPLATLERGYAVARGLDGRALTSVDAFGSALPFDLVLRDGVVRARAESVLTRGQGTGQ
jgi:exodeoxyribonuclease VII large subunit